MHGESSPQVSWWCVIVVPAELVDPSVVRTTWTTLPAVLGKMAESQINMTPECLVCWRIFGKPGNVTELHRRQNSDGVLWDPTPGRDRCALRPRSSWCGPADGSWIGLFGAVTSCGKPPSPSVVHRPRVLSSVHVSRTKISYTRIFVDNERYQ